MSSDEGLDEDGGLLSVEIRGSFLVSDDDMFNK
jgi:hypothetical protein